MKHLYLKISIAFALISLLTINLAYTQGVNMNRYITLTVQTGQEILLGMSADTDNTPVKIVSGDKEYNITVDIEATEQTPYMSGADTMTVYGNITTFKCNNNQEKLIGIDVGRNTILKKLSCSNNQLNSLDVSHNIVLEELSCHNNQLNNLDISHNTVLINLVCFANSLTHLNTSQNTALTGLYCSDNGLTSLNISQNTALTHLSCSGNQLTFLDVSQQNTELYYLSCYSNPFNIQALDDIYCALPMRTMNEPGELLIAWDTTDVNHANVLASSAKNAIDKHWIVKYDNYQMDTLVTTGSYECYTANMNRYITLTVQNGKEIRLDVAADADTIIPVKIISGDREYNIIANENYIGQSAYISGADTMTIYGDITKFNCDYNWEGGITDIDISHNTNLVSLCCSGNQLTDLDISQHLALTELRCAENNLSSLDVSQHTALQILDCSYNPINNLDISQNINLRELYCYYNQLNTLNISNNLNLEVLVYAFNNLNSLDVSQHTALQTLDCSYNSINNLDISQNINLKKLYCAGNNLTTLDISKHTNLERLSSSSNPLNHLDVSSNLALQHLDCANNNLNDLDVSQNINLQSLFCADNQISHLDLSKNVNLRKLFCFDNSFSTQALDLLYCSLPKIDSTDYCGAIYPLNNAEDGNYNNVIATNKQNAIDKNWKVVYFDNYGALYYIDIPTTGTYDCSVGIEENTANTHIAIYPNPVTDRLHIDTPAKIIEVQIYNISGALVTKIKNHTDISVAHLPKGIYALKVLTEQGVYTQKMIKE